MANSSAHSLRAGFQQSGGAYFVCVTPLSGTDGNGTTIVTLASGLQNNSSHLYKLTKEAVKSGGAFEPAQLVLVSALEVLSGTSNGAGTTWTGNRAATEFAQGQLIRDMGRTIVDKDGRTFRKFAVVGGNRTAFGVEGLAPPAAGPGAGYGTFYLDVGRDGMTPATIPAPIARYY